MSCKKSKTLLHETKKCCELMRSVIRGKIWEGRCGFGTEEQRTSGKKEYVVDSHLRAFSTQLFAANIGTISFTRASYSYFDTSLHSHMD